ncbi:MAG: GNAT family N-acetyltransferase, partial [Candidatus Bathyarchaeia archaeon]
MKIVPYHDADKHLWNRLVDESDEAWLYHRTEWVDLVAALYPNESFMITSDDGQPLGVFCVYRSSRGTRRGFRQHFLFTGLGRSGPALAKGLDKKLRRAAMDFSLLYLKERAKVWKATYLEAHLPTLAPAYMPPLRTEVNPLIECGFIALPRYGSTVGLSRLHGVETPTTIIDLQANTEEQLFAACSKACRNLVRKAIQSGVTCEQNNGVSGVEAFYKPFQSSFRRSRSGMSPISFFQEMHTSFADKGFFRLFIASRGANPIASVLLLCYKDAVTYYAGGMDYDAHHLSPHNLLIWESIRWAWIDGKKWYEMGPYFPYLSLQDKMARIGNFKREFGGRPYIL